MTNQDQAAHLIMEAARESEVPTETAINAVEALAQAGLLMPDLPESNDPSIFVPDGKGWIPGGPHGLSVWTAPGGRVMVQRVEPGDLTPDEAHFFALAVLAAAQYSKEKA